MARPGRGKIVGFALTLLGGLLALSSLGQTGSIYDLFAGADYEAARSALAGISRADDPENELIWRLKLETRPEMALSLAQGVYSDNPEGDPVETAARLDAAAIEFTRGRFSECLTILDPVIHQDARSAPGSAFLWAGLSQRALGQLQQSRELLASVQPEDEAFPLARYYLGDIALDQGDPVLAQRYLEAARSAGLNRIGVLADAARWRALQAQGETQAAAELLEALRSLPVDRLALLDLPAIPVNPPSRSDSSDSLEAAGPKSDTGRGRYCLQFGAFADRSLALAFVRRNQDSLPGLHIEKIRDEVGRNFYKVRSGGFASPVQARNEAARLKNQLGIDAFVTERDPSLDSQD